MGRKSYFGIFSKLSKAKLSLLVVATSAGGFVAGSGEEIDWRKLGWTSLGTFMCSASANTLNQIIEVKNDALMSRTRARPLPAGLITRRGAAAFALLMGLSGAAILSEKTNALTASLGVGNILLYAGVYTPLKVLHPVNTWVGAVVGAIPPLMGWAAAAGQLQPGAGFLAAVLYFWQMPHFMALSWMSRADYAAGGYRMLSLRDATGRRTAACALRHSVYLLPLGMAACVLDIAYEPFAWIYAALGVGMLGPAVNFHAAPSTATARLLFRASLWHLPVTMLAMGLCRVPNTGEAYAGWDDFVAKCLRHFETPGDQPIFAQSFPFMTVPLIPNPRVAPPRARESPAVPGPAPLAVVGAVASADVSATRV